MKSSICLRCKTEFMYDQWDRTGKFCSIPCFRDSQNKPVEAECKICGNNFSYYKSTRKGDVCCSFKCTQINRHKKKHESFLNKPEHEKLQLLKERYEKHVIKKDGCWEWTAAKVLGYGMLKFARKQMKAHRISWLIHCGTIPDGMFVLHKCLKNRQCTNPDHLYLGSYLENNHDIMKAGDRKVALTEEKVMEIRKLIEIGVPCSKVARQFNVGSGAIFDIKNKKTWRHLL